MIHVRKIISVIVTACIAFITFVSPLHAPVHAASKNTPASDSVLPSIVDGHKRYIVRFLDDLSNTAISALLSKFAAKQQRKFSRAFNGGVIDMPPGQAKKLQDSSSVLWLEEDSVVQSTGIVSPTPSWGLDRIDQNSLPLDSIYSFASDGAGVTSYVLDTGIKIGHSEFANRFRNGYDAFAQDGDDCNGHGTHVAGTLGGSTYGVAPGTSLVSVRVLDCKGSGSLSGVISGIEWVISDHVSGPAVINLSFGTSKSASLESAVDRAFADGITVVVAAGNAGVDACNTSPAGDKASALTIGATTNADIRASYSNYGTCVDLFAPGSGIISANYLSETTAVSMSGTSMATPHVAGIAARILSANVNASPSTVMNIIVNSAANGAVVSAGTGSPNKLAFIDGIVIPTAPSTTTTPPSDSFAATGEPGTGTPQNPTKPGKTSRPRAIASSLSARATWTESSNGGLPITGHVVRVYLKNSLVEQVIVDADTVHTIGGMLAARTYSITVAAMNGLGVGPFSDRSNEVVPVKTVKEYQSPSPATASEVLPTPPHRIKLSKVAATLSIRWTPPQNAIVSAYNVYIYIGSKVRARVTTSSTGGIRIAGLTRGTYSVHVNAVNAAGESKFSRHQQIRL